MNDNLQASELKIYAQQALHLMDLTSLNDDDTDQSIAALCKQANTQAGLPAALCIYKQFIPHAKACLASLNIASLPIATVVNFPHGNTDIDQVVLEIAQAISLGADEIDVVFPYKAFMAGDITIGADLVSACRRACPKHILLKVIIESGELKTHALISQASTIAINAGADFIKTSTGKVAINATLAAAKSMLEAIAASSSTTVGFKAAGGVKSAQDAAQYLDLAEQILGKDWITPRHFRFGASSLLGSLLKTLEHHQLKDNQSKSAY